MTSTTTSPPATPLQASRRQGSPQAATAVASAAATARAAAGRVALVAGATGLVGRAVLARLLAADTCSAVHAVGRRAPTIEHPKLMFHHNALTASFAAPAVDDVYVTLGTTIKQAGSAAAFRAVDVDAVVTVARACRLAGATRLGVVSAMGADARSNILYSRAKGEMEDAVQALGFEVLVIARPSLLLGDRGALNQTPRPAEKIAQMAGGLFGGLLPANYRPVHAAQVANALVHTVCSCPAGRSVLLSGDLLKY
jgi:uncharacterized protein YbjT (DUF2867 family)